MAHISNYTSLKRLCSSVAQVAASVRCPPRHPFPYAKGLRCCAVGYDSDINGQGGDLITLDSTTCGGNDTPCPHSQPCTKPSNEVGISS